MAIAKNAGSSPRRMSSVHHATVSAQSALGSTPANFHSLLARKRSIMSLVLHHLVLDANQ
jgi:hypothetical protein